MRGEDRFVVLGLAPARSEWFRSVARWATSGAVPVEFIKCLSAEEVRARLGSGRPFSALVADARLPAVDRDLCAAARRSGCTVVVVDDGRAPRDWSSLGADRVLAPDFDRSALLETLAGCARRIRRGEATDVGEPAPSSNPVPWRGRVVTVTGPGGTGASTVAIALAQATGDDVRQAAMVLLADLCLHAEQAMLHDARDVVPGVQELVDAHRGGRPTAAEVRALTFEVVERRYHLMLGLRRASFWPAVRPRAFEAAFDSLRQAYRLVVCDVDADLEGEEVNGSVDVEERNVMARTAAANADVALVVGLPSMKGLHALVRVMAEQIGGGVPPDRLVAVLNRSPSSGRARGRLERALAELLQPVLDQAGHQGRMLPVAHVPERRVDELLRDGVRLPAALTQPASLAVRSVLSTVGPRPPASHEPVRVAAGSLGRWAE